MITIMSGSWLDERTNVQTEDNRTVFLKDLKIGQKLWTLKPNGLQDLTVVTKIDTFYGVPQSQIHHLKLTDTCKLVCCGETLVVGHVPVSPRVWIPAKYLTTKDKLVTFVKIGGLLPVKEVFNTGAARSWISLETSEGSFLANFILVGG